MSLRRVAVLLAEKKNSHWEVDESGLVVKPAPEDRAQWMVYSPFETQKDYLERHALQCARFSTRARAVETIRVCLASEPLPLNQPLTRWTPQPTETGEKLYLARDGHWELQVFPGYHKLRPHSPAAQAASLSLDGSYSLRGATLRSCAFAADILNSVYSLTV